MMQAMRKPTLSDRPFKRDALDDLVELMQFASTIAQLTPQQRRQLLAQAEERFGQTLVQH